MAGDPGSVAVVPRFVEYPGHGMHRFTEPTPVPASVGGGDCYQVLSREPMLSSRVYVWQEFRRMTPEQVLRVIPAFHPVWERTDSDVISFADAHAGHGNFRSWAKLTAHTVRALERLDRDRVDREVLGSVFAKMSGRSG